MNTGNEHHGRFYDPDMKLPPAVLHLFPIVLALFTLTMSVAGYSIFFGFDENEPITWMSLSLMLAVQVSLLAVIRHRDLEPVKRWAAIVLSAVTGFAILDETHGWHEDVGRYVKNEFDFFTRDVRHYTDDAIAVLFAVAGTILFFVFLRKLQNRRDYVPYVICAAGLAFAHGFLDILGHGGRLWRALIPDITGEQVDLLTETLGFYEEACKLWAEWFVLLFVLRFFYRQRGPLAWSMLVMIGSFLSGIGLWAIEDPSAGVPYVVMERTLRLIRNYHLLIGLAAIFSVWTIVSWRLFGDQPKKQALAGLFFLTPFYAVLPEIAQVFVGFSFARFAGQPWLLLSIGGVFFPLAVGLLVRGHLRGRRGMVLSAIAVAAVLVQNPLVLLAAFGVTLAVLIEWEEAPMTVKAWSALIALQAAVITLIFYFSASGILPEYRFKVPEKVLFETGRQKIDPDYYRSDS